MEATPGQSPLLYQCTRIALLCMMTTNPIDCFTLISHDSSLSSVERYTCILVVGVLIRLILNLWCIGYWCTFCVVQQLSACSHTFECIDCYLNILLVRVIFEQITARRSPMDRTPLWCEDRLWLHLIKGTNLFQRSTDSNSPDLCLWLDAITIEESCPSDSFLLWSAQR